MVLYFVSLYRIDNISSIFNKIRYSFFNKNVFVFYIFIYILICINQIIDSTDVQLWVFHLIEIKNILFYAGMLYILITKINKTIRF